MSARRKTLAGTLMLLGLLVATFATALPVAASAGGNTEGCTPGYWKNHPESWQEYLPTQTIASVYAGAPAPFGGLSLMDGLSLKGGPRIAGAQEILLRAAIASLLNAAYDSPDGAHLLFPWRRNDPGVNGEPPLIPTVNAALTSGDRNTILALASRLDAANNLGCPLN